MTWENVVTGLSNPINFEFVSDKNPTEMWVTEKNTGRVKHIFNGTVRIVLDLQVSNSTDRGLLGIVKHPDFEQNRWVYLYYSTSPSGEGADWLSNRVVRFEWTGDEFINPLLIWETFTDPNQPNGNWHQGGVMAFGPDRKLYIVTGDLHRGRIWAGRIEQNTHATLPSGVGGILRLNDDGTTPSDNPFVSHSAESIRRMWTYGLRNSFGIEFDPRTGILWYTENGPDFWDEINYVERGGMNSGWLLIMGPDSRDARYPENNQTAFNASNLVNLPNSYYQDPVFSWYNTIGPIACKFITSARFSGDWSENLFMTDTNTAGLYLFKMRPDRKGFLLDGPLSDQVADNLAEREMNRIGSTFWTITDVKFGADGFMYLLGHAHGRILRIRPVSPPPVLNGKAVLENYAALPLNMPITIRLRNETTNELHDPINSVLDWKGNFSVRAPSGGTFSGSIKVGTYLSQSIEEFTLAANGYIYLDPAFGANGDVNGDDIVDDADLLIVLESFGTDGLGDVNGDGIVDDLDLAIVLESFGLAGHQP
ncbi:MAG: PQQ-dependent sugar dehydrogenase [Armatimonadetes bacterium]|nr:PQQ-dependent sugar dehydrogenase [Armatimonadota bacterium]